MADRPPQTTGADQAADLPPLESLQAIPDIRIERLLAHGGMGLIYLAHHQVRKCPVAVKIARPHRSRRRSHRSSLVHEAQMMAHLEHPHIVQVHDFGHRGDLVWMVMEWVDGLSLAHALGSLRPPPREALRIAGELLAALNHCHAQGIVHRDLKPGNILLNHQRQVKLIDFGLAHMQGLSYTIERPGRVAGTKHYMAPEQRSCDDIIDHRVDVYAFGVILWELLTGCRSPIGSFLLTSNGFPPSLGEVIDKCLAPRPEQRWATVEALQETLQSVTVECEELTTPWTPPSVHAGYDLCLVSSESETETRTTVT